MRHFFMMIVASIFVMLSSNNARADLPPAPEQCASQENCFAIMSNDTLYFYRKGVEKANISTPETGPGTIRYSNGYLVATWQVHNIVWLYNIATGNQCWRDVGMSCKEGVVFGQYAYVACPDNYLIIKMPLDCTTHQEILAGSFNQPTSLATSASEILVSSNGDNRVGSIDPNTLGHSLSFTTLTSMGVVRYHAGNNLVYFDGVDDQNQPGIFYKSLPLQNNFDTLPLLYLPGEAISMAMSDTHMVVASYYSETYIVDIANQTYTTMTQYASMATAISDDTICARQGGVNPIVRFYDLQGGERTEYSPIPILGISMDYIKPHVPAACGNGLIEPGEVCDGSDFDGQTCVDQGFSGGVLNCNVSCSAFNTTTCWVCGDGVKTENEECDGNDFGTVTCGDYQYASGSLSCNSSCQIDSSGCHTCGDGFVEGPEQCEDTDLNGETCVSQGYISGDLACGSDCTYDTSGCNSCGDGVINFGDVCDGAAINESCQSMGFDGGTIACNSTCDGYDTSACTQCGNGEIEGSEECDLSNLNGASCSSLGYGTGTLTCYGNCTYNVQACSTPPEHICGDNVVDPGEQCDDGNRDIGDGCDDNCQLEPVQTGCGNALVEADEQCDGTALDGATCQSLGFISGAMSCKSNCTLNSGGCTFGAFQAQGFSIKPNATPSSGLFTDIQINAYNDMIGSKTKSCQSSMDGNDLLITTPADGYCSVELTYEAANEAGAGKVFIVIYKPINSLNDANALLRIRPDGSLGIESGGHMRAQKGAYPRITLGNNEVNESSDEDLALREELLSKHPDSGVTGRFALVEMASGLNTYCSPTQPDKCAVIVGGQREILDLDKLEESLGEIGRTPKRRGCSVAGGSSGNSTIPVFLVVTVLFLAIRIRRRK